ncbi:MAG: HU family DNA-binding protein [Flavobacterium sp.]|nr:HU family DNA-binding protein [Flavobacterium sp.]
MAVKYKVIKKINPLKKDDPKKSYATIASEGEITLKQISKRIAAMSTVNSGDVLAVLDLLVQVMQEELSNGKTLRFGDFGSFALSLSSEGKNTDDEVTAAVIKAAKILFRPGSDLKKMLATLNYQKA